jgi:hypothetical protein
LLSVPARVAQRLVTLAHLHGRETQNGVELSISQDEMARFLGLSRQLSTSPHLTAELARDIVHESVLHRREGLVRRNVP